MKKKRIFKTFLILGLIGTYGTWETVKFGAGVLGMATIEEKISDVPDWAYDLLIFSFYYDWFIVLGLLALVFYRWEIENGTKKLLTRLK